MKREIIKTGDGSATIFLPEWNEHYHSKHGAVQEALHVFIKSGLTFFTENNSVQKLSILEIGFGTGLNALVTFLEARKKGISIEYTGVEAYPVASEELAHLNYASSFEEEEALAEEIFQKIHQTEWSQKGQISEAFNLEKQQQFFDEITAKDEFDLIYFDAFGPRVQPDLWTVEIFRKMYRALHPGGMLVTYSAKGSVRRAMQEVGFEVERIPGPPGKREMLRAVKPLA
ncbi:MAG: tRNA (5-methylaminomethyl-2-thiouridine)(34)-methyltransferase MnmD [Salinimicrobium sp.]